MRMVWLFNMKRSDGSAYNALLALVQKELHALGETMEVITKARHDAKLQDQGISTSGSAQLERWLQASFRLSYLPCVVSAPGKPCHL